MSDLEIYASIASNLEEASWSSIFSQLDTETFTKLQSALDSLKEVSETPDEKLSDDPSAAITQLNAKLNKILKGLKAHRGRFNRIENRISSIESTGNVVSASSVSSLQYEAPNVINIGGGIKPIKKKKKRKLKSMVKTEDIKDDTLKQRKHFYQFGYRKLQVLKPTEGYPTKKEAQRPVEGKLELFYAHGYSGNFDESRQNIYLSHDGNKLIYYIAAVAVVYDFKNNTQRFFTKHNDDITTICLSPKKKWAATGQKDPKDEPGQGADLPKIWIWNYEKTDNKDGHLKPVQLIDNVCWGKIGRLQWSKATNILYCICGDPEQTLKSYDPEEFKGKKQPQSLINATTMKEAILGFVIRDQPDKAYFDEFIIYGKRKFCHVGIVQKGNKLTSKIKAVSITMFQKEGEKHFGCAQWLPDGRYIVGAKSGAIYVGRNSSCLQVIGCAHDKSVGCLIVYNKHVFSAGFDKRLKRWAIAEEQSMDDSKEEDVPKKKKKVSTPKSPTTKKKVKKVKKASALVERWQIEIDMADTDYILQPKAMVYNQESGTLFVGSKTNQIMKFEIANEDASVVVDGHDGQIWGLCTHPQLALFATGGYDNAVKIWDAETMKCIKTYEFELEQGDKKGHEISCGHWSNDGSVIVFGTENTSSIAVFSYDSENNDLKFQQMVEIVPKSKNAEVEPVAYLRFSEDSSLLAAAHMDSNLYIYSVASSPGRVVIQQWPMGLPHCAAPVNVQFSSNGKLVKTLTRDYEVCHWQLDEDKCKGTFVPRIPDPDIIGWADDPLIAGWDVEGLYQKGWDGTDLNDATLTSDSKLIATGDDYGKVRLHNYPSTDQKTCNVYEGHAEFVVGVEFLRDDSQLITAGGADMAIFQWKLHKNYKDEE